MMREKLQGPAKVCKGYDKTKPKRNEEE